MNDRWKKRCTPRRGTLRRVTFSIEFGCGETELRNVRCRFDGGPYPARCRPSPRHRAAAVAAAGPHPGGGVTCGRAGTCEGPAGITGTARRPGRQRPRRQRTAQDTGPPQGASGHAAGDPRSARHAPRAARRPRRRWPRGPFIFSGAARPVCGGGGLVSVHGVRARRPGVGTPARRGRRLGGSAPARRGRQGRLRASLHPPPCPPGGVRTCRFPGLVRAGVTRLRTVPGKGGGTVSSWGPGVPWRPRAAVRRSRGWP